MRLVRWVFGVAQAVLIASVLYPAGVVQSHPSNTSGDIARFVTEFRQFRQHVHAKFGPLPFPKWESALHRFLRDPYGSVHGAFENQWNAFIYSIRGEDQLRKALLTNDYINFIGYVTDDADPSQGRDYWRSPLEFFQSRGDCEDAAIAKYWTLRKSGILAEDLRIIVVYSKTLRAPHAVVRVSTELGEYILDNQAPYVFSVTANTKYNALYAINENSAFWFRDRSILAGEIYFHDMLLN